MMTTHKEREIMIKTKIIIMRMILMIILRRILMIMLMRMMIMIVLNVQRLRVRKEKDKFAKIK